MKGKNYNDERKGAGGTPKRITMRMLPESAREIHEEKEDARRTCIISTITCQHKRGHRNPATEEPGPVRGKGRETMAQKGKRRPFVEGGIGRSRGKSS